MYASSPIRIAVVVALTTLIHIAHTGTQASDPHWFPPSICDRNNDPTQIAVPDPCNLTVFKQSVDYFRAKLDRYGSHFMRFNIIFNSSTPVRYYNATQQTFKLGEWVWTYESTTGLLPYLYWNIDYSILSFGLLDAKTLPDSNMWIKLSLPTDCSITFGTTETTCAIGRALTNMIGALVNASSKYLKYESSYFCYLAENPEYESRDTIGYLAAVYFLYPISYINYNCCETVHDYVDQRFNVSCRSKQIEKWTQCTTVPYILGVIIFLFFPIWMCRIASWTSSDEEVVSSEYETLDPSFTETDASGGHLDRDTDGWVYLDGDSPYNFKDLLSHVWCGLNNTWPTAVSRVKRLVWLLLMPLGVYIHVFFYKIYFLENTQLLLKHDKPMGFLALLGDDSAKHNAFVPILGGPVGLAILYYSIGLLLLVVPRSPKQIFENGMPTQGTRFKSPLRLSARVIKRLSMADGSLEPGYIKGVTLFKCGFIMLFSKQFWKHVFRVQVERLFGKGNNSPVNAVFILKILVLPFYAALCIAEIILCLLLYGFPMCMFIVGVIRGSTRSLGSFRTYMTGRFTQSSTLNQLILNNPFIRLLTCICVAGLILLFTYVNILVFIETFQFICQIIVFCFVAVIVFPSVSFGYLFFSVVLCYYIGRRIRDFGDCYLELLSEAVEISRQLDGRPNNVTFIGDLIMVENVKAQPTSIKTIQINDTILDVVQNNLQPAVKEASERPKIKQLDNVYAIPRDLFTYLVNKHRPAHQQLLKIAFNILLIFVLLYMTMSISHPYMAGPSSEISEVMHVIFIVAVGALPHVLEVTLVSANTSVRNEIELRNLEQSIVAFWRNDRVE